MNYTLQLCSLLINTSHVPDVMLKQFYQQYYQCPIVQLAQPTRKPDIAPEQVSMLFPAQSYWWPVFTIDQIGSASFQRVLHQKIRPGVLVSYTGFSPLTYWKVKQAVDQGAIPLFEFSTERPAAFSSHAVIASAMGIRPLGVYSTSGWTPMLLALPKGLYVIEAQPQQLPLPSREIQFGNHYFYNANQYSGQNIGMNVIVNPPKNIVLSNVRYPKLGIAWNFHGVDFESTPEGLETSIWGYTLLLASVSIVPLYLLLSIEFPEILGFFGTSASWLSLVLGLLLILLLVSTIIIRLVKRHDTH
ncbi:hypothetical protein C9426_20395 [Serratia sp. S1B]|nr:hypothetical protein C9426_20395 [Serratia sp. S1B]